MIMIDFFAKGSTLIIYKPFFSWSKLNKEPFDMNWVTNIKSGKLIHAPITGKTLAELNILDYFLNNNTNYL